MAALRRRAPDANSTKRDLQRRGGARGVSSVWTRWWEAYGSTWHIFAMVTGFKALLAGSTQLYRSTDFEQHRHALAVAYKQPTTKWYAADGPGTEAALSSAPLFALLQGLLARLAALIDSSILEFRAGEGPSRAALLFHRGTVIVLDVVLYVGALLYVTTWSRRTRVEVRRSHAKTCIVVSLVLTTPGLIFVDHVHFQFTGLFVGGLLLSVAAVRLKYDVLAAVTITALGMANRIFLYAAPLFFVYLLRHYCYVPLRGPARDAGDSDGPEAEESEFSDGFSSASASDVDAPRRSSGTGQKARGGAGHDRHFSWRRLVFIVGCVSVVLVGCVVPFVGGDDPGASLRGVAGSLLPFGEPGLTHTYWAPNVWALYNTADVALRFIVRHAAVFFGAVPPAVGTIYPGDPEPTTTSGVIGTRPSVLPEVDQGMTIALALLAMLPVLVDVWRKPHPRTFITALAYCGMCGFMLGWHVRETTILLVTVPLTLVAADSGHMGQLLLLLTLISLFSLFPLLFRATEAPILPLLSVAYLTVAFATLDYFHRLQQLERRIAPTGVASNLWSSGRSRHSLMDLPGVMADAGVRLYVLGFPPLYCATMLFSVLYSKELPFLSLMCTSAYCAVGMVYSWSVMFLRHMSRSARVDTYRH